MTQIKPKIFQALTIASALKLYAKTGIKANRSYTPSNMIAAAREITGKNFKPQEYLAAAEALEEWAEQHA
jgi:hypothetical protein